MIDGRIPELDTVFKEYRMTSQYSSICGTIMNKIRLENLTTDSLHLEAVLDVALSVHRAAYTQLTPRGPISIPSPSNSISVGDRGDLQITNSNLPGRLQIFLLVEGRPVSFSCPPTSSTGIVSHQHRQGIDIPGGRAIHLTTTFSLSHELRTH